MSDYVQRKVLELATGMAAVQEQDGDLFVTASSLIASVIEDCAAQCEDASTVGDFYAKRIRSMSTPTTTREP